MVMADVQVGPFEMHTTRTLLPFNRQGMQTRPGREKVHAKSAPQTEEVQLRLPLLDVTDISDPLCQLYDDLQQNIMLTIQTDWQKEH